MLGPRKEKKIERKAGLADEVMQAYYLGMDDAHYGRPYRNPYPAGKRHDEYERGFDLGDDPLGDHHGENR